jgi:hypothetical protein
MRDEGEDVFMSPHPSSVILVLDNFSAPFYHLRTLIYVKNPQPAVVRQGRISRASADP